MAAPIFDSKDVESNRVTGGIGYILPFVPYFACKNSAFGRYCANQGLILWIAILLVSIVFGIVSGVLGWFPLIGGMVRWLLGTASHLVRTILIIVGCYCSFIAIKDGRATEIPVIGTLNLIK